MQTRRGDGKFNSTMKNGHQNYSPGNYSKVTTTLTTSARTGAHNRIGSTDAGS